MKSQMEKLTGHFRHFLALGITSSFAEANPLPLAKSEDTQRAINVAVVRIGSKNLDVY